MTNKECIEIFDHNWTKLVNPEYTNIELGQAQDLAFKALEVVEKIKKVRDKREFPEYFEEDVLNILDESYGNNQI